MHYSVVSTNTQFASILTIIYTSNDLWVRQDLYKDIITLGAPIQVEWLVYGDFNNILRSGDRIGAPVTQYEVQGFKDMIKANQFTPLKSSERHFRWCNKHAEDIRVYSKIDWALGNY